MSGRRRAAVATAAVPGAPKTLAEFAYERLRVDIRSGKLEPGSRLRTGFVKAVYGIGISPLREALIRLAAENLAVAEGQRGFRVAPLSLTDFEDVLALRHNLEREALRASIRLGDDHWEARIVACLHRLSKAPPVGAHRDPELMEERETRHRALHRALLGACDSTWTLRVWEQLEAHLERYRRVVLFRNPAHDPEPATTEREHREIAHAVIRRDFRGAWHLLERHRARSCDAIGRALRAQATEP